MIEMFKDFQADDGNCRAMWVPPERFLELTGMGMAEKIRAEAGLFDEGLWFAADEPPQLWVNAATGRVFAHEGRHRAAAAANSGFPVMPVFVILIDFDDPWGKDVLEMPAEFVPQRPWEGVA